MKDLEQEGKKGTAREQNSNQETEEKYLEGEDLAEETLETEGNNLNSLLSFLKNAKTMQKKKNKRKTKFIAF